MRLGTVTFTSGGTLRVEITETFKERCVGLAGRPWLLPVAGMLFDHGQAFDTNPGHYVSMWMRDTLIPLDMIWLTSDGLVTGVVEAAAPLSDRLHTGYGRYVLETNAGWARANGIAPGARMHLSYD